MRVVTLQEVPGLRLAFQAIERAVWGPLPFLDFGVSSTADYFGLLTRHDDHQLGLLGDDGYPIATANTLPVPYVPATSLPESGWDWAVQQCAALDPATPNHERMLAALAISVPVHHRNAGIARRMIQEVKALGQRLGYRCVVVPARPSAKHLHPDVPIEEYFAWRTADGSPFDPWLRSHVRVGGELIKPCPQSMQVVQPEAFWRLWVPAVGWPVVDPLSVVHAAVPGGLVPVMLHANVGQYIEPGVWVLHSWSSDGTHAVAGDR